MNKYEAIIFDLDGTAVPNKPDGMPSEELVRITRDSRDKIPLCAATGRSWQMAKNIIGALGLIYPCVVAGGAMIVDPSDEEIIWQEIIPADVQADILKIAIKYGYEVAYVEGLTTTHNHKPGTHRPNSPLNTFYILNVPFTEAKKIISEVKNIEIVTISEALSWKIRDGVDLHITNRSSTKEHAVMELCRVIGIDRTRVAGVGDGQNDIHLFNTVGYKVAMGNAVPELKEHADIIIKSLDEEGLSDFIRESTAN